MLQFKNNDNIDITLQQIVDLISKDNEYEVYVGSDSQKHSDKKTVYVTCIVLRKKGKGGRIFTCKTVEKSVNSLKQRLQNEVWRSLEVAFEMKKILPQNIELIVHIDVNEKKNFKSSDYVNEFVSMIVSQGFKCIAKPDAWCAQTVANKETK